MITWSNYLSAVSIFLIGYYALVLLICFRKEIVNKFRVASLKTTAARTSLQTNEVSASVEDNGFHPMPLLDEVHAYMNQASVDLPIEQEVIVAGVKSILQKYPPLVDPFFRLSINDLVVSLAESKCNVEISPDVLARMWK